MFCMPPKLSIIYYQSEDLMMRRVSSCTGKVWTTRQLQSGNWNRKKYLETIPARCTCQEDNFRASKYCSYWPEFVGFMAQKVWTPINHGTSAIICERHGKGTHCWWSYSAISAMWTLYSSKTALSVISKGSQTSIRTTWRTHLQWCMGPSLCGVDWWIKILYILHGWP